VARWPQPAAPPESYTRQRSPRQKGLRSGVVRRRRTLLATPLCAWQNLAQGRSVVIVLAPRKRVAAAAAPLETTAANVIFRVAAHWRSNKISKLLK